MAANYLIHDRYGWRIGTVDWIDGDTLIVHDRYGWRIRTLTPDPGGEAVIEDRFGRNIGALAPKMIEKRSSSQTQSSGIHRRP